MNLNDFSKWLQYNRVKNLRGSEYFPYPLCVYIYIYNIYINKNININTLLYKISGETSSKYFRSKGFG